MESKLVVPELTCSATMAASKKPNAICCKTTPSQCSRLGSADLILNRLANQIISNPATNPNTPTLNAAIARPTFPKSSRHCSLRPALPPRHQRIVAKSATSNERYPDEVAVSPEVIPGIGVENRI